MGQGRDLQPLLDWGAESKQVQLLFLIADYKTFFDPSFPRHFTDIVQILLLPQAISFWETLGNNQQVHRQCSYLTVTRCSKDHALIIPVILPSGSGLGVRNKAIILRKTWRIIITQFLNICCFSKCYFCEISQGCESMLLGILTPQVDVPSAQGTVSLSSQGPPRPWLCPFSSSLGVQAPCCLPAWPPAPLLTHRHRLLWVILAGHSSLLPAGRGARREPAPPALCLGNRVLSPLLAEIHSKSP